MLKHNLSKSFILLLLPLIISVSGAAIRYSMDDLRVLYNEKSSKEFLEHAHDIVPSKRDSNWRQMLSEMASHHVDELIKLGRYNQKSFVSIEKLYNLPTLKNDDRFTFKRNRYGVKFFSSCVNRELEKKECAALLQEFWLKRSHKPDDVELGIKVASLMEKLQDQRPSWDFYRPAATSSVSSLYCRKSSFRQALFLELGHLMKKSTELNETLKTIPGLMNRDCLNALKPNLVEVIENETTRNSDLAYLILKSFNEITPAQENFYLTTYFLKSPVVGDRFNMAWNTLDKLAKNYEEREVVMEKLKVLDQLPGKIFSINDQKRRAVLYDHVLRSIPEYFDLYGRTCLSYMEGEKSFPQGNPTLECQDYFKTASAKSYISQPLKLRYSALKKAKFPKNSPTIKK